MTIKITATDHIAHAVKLAKSAPKGERRIHLTHVLMDGEKIVATDGCRLSVVDLESEHAGLFRIGKVNKHFVEMEKSEDSADYFPDWKTCFKIAKKEAGDPHRIDTHGENAALAKYYREGGLIINANFFLALPGDVYKVSWSEHGVVFLAETATHVIMPILDQSPF